MSSRFVPYATTPSRFVGQFISDIVVLGWTIVWLSVGAAVHSAVSTIATVGREVEAGANGIAGNLDAAGGQADDVPLIGQALATPLRAASDAALE
ncbi:membrane protein, partial [Mycolicibacterium elephantis]